MRITRISALGLTSLIAFSGAACGSEQYSSSDRANWCEAFESAMLRFIEADSTGETDSPLVAQADTALLELGTLEPPPEIADDVQVVMSFPPDILDYDGDPEGFEADWDRYNDAGDSVNRYLIDTCQIDPQLVNSSVG